MRGRERRDPARHGDPRPRVAEERLVSGCLGEDFDGSRQEADGEDVRMQNRIDGREQQSVVVDHGGFRDEPVEEVDGQDGYPVPRGARRCLEDHQNEGAVLPLVLAERDGLPA